jgi:anaerobic selenocysteine-containing dehydrogenase
VGKRGENRWRQVSWEEALGEMVDHFTRIKQESGAEYLAMAQGTGKPCTEWTSRFANAFGTPNFVGPAHICFLPRVIASGLTLGRLPICDIYGLGGEKPACILIWGCNITHSGPLTGCAEACCKGLSERPRK